ncbi:plasmid mobilization protein [Psychrobacter cibarius]|uniref:plasmid mobilization protein n=1 Tax=Psychrobacter cibarius TaxID=282669 RepID=UPI0018DF1462|nr:plasmid mobilization relaxosome protein MobC [Psychrobacter cibarius]
MSRRSRKRSREITIRVTDDELQKLHERKTDATLAGWMRNLGLGVTPVKQVDPELVRALGRIGSNLNQTTRHANINKELDRKVLAEITAIREVIADLVKKNLKDDD